MQERPAIFRRNWEKWLLLAALIVGVPLGAWFLLPEPSRLREPARRATCKSNLRQIALACHMYADDNDGQLPDGFGSMYPSYLDDVHALMCPSVTSDCHQAHRAVQAGDFTHGSIGFTLLPGLHQTMPAHLILAYDRSLANHKGAGRNVAFADAHVAWWPAEREEEFQRRLREQRVAVKRWRAAGAKAEDMEKFFGKPGKESPTLQSYGDGAK